MYNITASSENEFTMYMEAGTVICMKLKDPSDDYELQISQPDGNIREESLYRKDSSWIAYGRSILKSGDYKFRFVPQNNPTVTLQFGFTNNNRNTLYDISSGNKISAILNGWGHEYAKFRLSLNKGDLLTVSDPSDDDISMYLADSNSRVHVSVNGGEVYKKVYADGEYYLFIVNTDSNSSSSYSGTVTVTPDPDISKYPVFENIFDQMINKKQSFSLQLTASNNPTKFTATGLPSGISIDESTGLISGISDMSGIFPIKVRTENEFGNDRKNFFLVIQNDLIWDIDDDKKWSLPDIIYGLQLLTGIKN